MNNPLVSIIIPVYNGSSYLKEAIDSALAQTYKNIEIIIVNDGSVDEGKTEEIALSYGEKIRYFSKENGGTSSALNYGISKMNGEYFSWLSHDDLYHENKIQKQIDVLNNGEVKENTIISTNSVFVDKNGSIIRKGKRIKSIKLSSEEFFKKLHVSVPGGCTFLIPKKLLLEVSGFDEKYKYIQDTHAWKKLAINGAEIYFVDEALTFTRIHNAQQTVKIKQYFIVEVNDYIHRYFESNYRNNFRDKVVMIYAIKLGCYKTIKNSYHVKSKITEKVYFQFLRLYYFFIRILKKIYWKLYRK